jgi:hypothetical protein
MVSINEDGFNKAIRMLSKFFNTTPINEGSHKEVREHSS